MRCAKIKRSSLSTALVYFDGTQEKLAIIADRSSVFHKHLFRLFNWKYDMERGPTAFPRHRMDRTVVVLRNPFDQRKAHARAIVLPGFP